MKGVAQVLQMEKVHHGRLIVVEEKWTKSRWLEGLGVAQTRAIPVKTKPLDST